MPESLHVHRLGMCWKPQETIRAIDKVEYLRDRQQSELPLSAAKVYEAKNNHTDMFTAFKTHKTYTVI